MGSLWEIPMIGFLVDEGNYAITQLNNINLPTTTAGFMTSVLEFQSMHGLPKIAASMNVTPVYRLFKSPDYKWPETKRSCFKVVTIIDSSGKYLAKEVKRSRKSLTAGIS